VASAVRGDAAMVAAVIPSRALRLDRLTAVQAGTTSASSSTRLRTCRDHSRPAGKLDTLVGAVEVTATQHTIEVATTLNALAFSIAIVRGQMIGPGFLKPPRHCRISFAQITWSGRRLVRAARPQIKLIASISTRYWRLQLLHVWRRESLLVDAIAAKFAQQRRS
jgi:hypothetical protein